MSNSPLFDPNMAKRHPINILLVDDNTINLKVASKMLLKMGYEVDQAINGAEALEAQKKNRYDLIFMDIQMPGMDGVTATKHIIDQYSDYERPRIVAVTAHAMMGDRERYLKAGMDGYISKPVRIGRLVEEIKGTSPIQSKQSNLKKEVAASESAKRLLNPAGLPKAIDVNMFAEMLGMSVEEADGMLPELIELFVADSVAQLNSIDKAIVNDDYTAVREAAHKIKGGAATIAAVRLSESCDALEQMGRNKQLQGAGIQFGQVKLEFNRVEAWLAERQLPEN